MSRPRRLKFNNRRCVYDGIKFDSQKERDRYIALKGLEIFGQIKDIEVHPKYVLYRRDKWGAVVLPAITFKPDFRYYDVKLGKVIVEEIKARITYRTKKLRVKKIKPLVTEGYRLRRNLFLRQLPENIIFQENF